MMLERGITVDHSTLYRWVQEYAPEIEKRLRWYRKPMMGDSWRVDETYVYGLKSIIPILNHQECTLFPALSLLFFKTLSIEAAHIFRLVVGLKTSCCISSLLFEFRSMSY